jgi:hypothetical protein
MLIRQKTFHGALDKMKKYYQLLLKQKRNIKFQPLAVVINIK